MHTAQNNKYPKLWDLTGTDLILMVYFQNCLCETTLLKSDEKQCRADWPALP